MSVDILDFLLSKSFLDLLVYTVLVLYLGGHALREVLHLCKNNGLFGAFERKINYERGVVYLHMFPRSCVKQMLNLSPFAIKLEMWLRLHKIPYKVVETVKFSKQTSQIPYVVYNGEDVTDSNHIIDMLTEWRTLDKTEGLSEEHQAVQRAFTTMIETSTSIVTFLYRYSYMCDEFSRLYKIPVPWFLEGRIKKNQSKGIREKAKNCGIGHVDSQHAARMAQRDLAAISHYLANKKYFFGDRVTTIDCVLFGHLSQVVYVDFPYPHKIALEKCTNILPYLDRLKSAHWPDWDQLVQPGYFKR